MKPVSRAIDRGGDAEAEEGFFFPLLLTVFKAMCGGKPLSAIELGESIGNCRIG
jgi:hypothetical protein